MTGLVAALIGGRLALLALVNQQAAYQTDARADRGSGTGVPGDRTNHGTTRGPDSSAG
jgi:hypothetical protein